MTTRYALFCEHLPDRDGERKITLGHKTFATFEQAEHECDQIRRQNFPFRAWPIAVVDPRVRPDVLTITVDGPVGSGVTRTARYLKNNPPFPGELLVVDMSELRDGRR